jgi:hypothetical protein
VHGKCASVVLPVPPPRHVVWADENEAHTAQHPCEAQSTGREACRSREEDDHPAHLAPFESLEEVQAVPPTVHQRAPLSLHPGEDHSMSRV